MCLLVLAVDSFLMIFAISPGIWAVFQKDPDALRNGNGSYPLDRCWKRSTKNLQLLRWQVTTRLAAEEPIDCGGGPGFSSPKGPRDRPEMSRVSHRAQQEVTLPNMPPVGRYLMISLLKGPPLKVATSVGGYCSKRVRGDLPRQDAAALAAKKLSSGFARPNS